MSTIDLPMVRIGDLQVGDIIIWKSEKWALTGIISLSGTSTMIFQRCIKGTTELEPTLRTDFGPYMEIRVPLFGRCRVTYQIGLLNRRTV